MNSAQRLRATYEFEPVDHLFRRDMYFWEDAIARWQREGMPADADQDALFGFDPPGSVDIGMLGWCEPAFAPPMEEKLIEETDEYQIVRDNAGRTVKFFRGRRDGFMPTYLKHAVENERDWHENIFPLLSPSTPARWEDYSETITGYDHHTALQSQSFANKIAQLKTADAEGMMITLNCIGGYMYLRSLVGPEEICLMFLDNPSLIHKMMQAWLDLADAVSARVQQHVEIDEAFLSEDICYNHGLLISPDMVREFLFPEYRQLLANIRSRQKHKRLFLQIDTDGNCAAAIELYLEIGMDVMEPFEIAAGNDIIAIGEKYPNLGIRGGIDKRVLAIGPEAIDAYLQRVIPYMVKRGGFIPTCDHGVPHDVSYADYLHYRRTLMELDH